MEQTTTVEHAFLVYRGLKLYMVSKTSKFVQYSAKAFEGFKSPVLPRIKATSLS